MRLSAKAVSCACAAGLCLFLLSPGLLGAEEGFKFQKDSQLIQATPKKGVKIKLKRLKNGKYTWEITGHDTKQIIEADRELKSLLKEKE